MAEIFLCKLCGTRMEFDQIICADCRHENGVRAHELIEETLERERQMLADPHGENNG